MDQDPATITNMSVEIVNDLNNYAKSRMTTLSQENSQISFAERLLAAASPMKRNERTDTNASQITCLESCQRDPQTKGKPITCSLCQNEFHPQCVGLSTNGRKAVWFCYSCRSIPRTLKNLEARYSKQSQEYEALKESNESLKATVHEQSALITSLQEQLAATTTSTNVPNVKPTSAKGSTLIIGDSMIKDINPRGLVSTDVHCMPGAKTLDIKEHLASQPTLPYDTVIVHVGTNDDDVEAAREAMKDTMTDITTKAPNATKVLSTACPRPDSDDNQTRIQNINDMIKETAANTTNCVIVDNDETFYKDGELDSNAYKYRSIHLSKTGTKTLLRNINACHRIIKESASAKKQPRHNTARPRPRHRQTAFHGHYHGGHYGPQPLRKRGCYHCGEQNHQKRDCRFTRPVQCYDCGDYGHKKGMNMCNY